MAARATAWTRSSRGRRVPHVSIATRPNGGLGSHFNGLCQVLANVGIGGLGCTCHRRQNNTNYDSPKHDRHRLGACWTRRRWRDQTTSVERKPTPTPTRPTILENRQSRVGPSCCLPGTSVERTGDARTRRRSTRGKTTTTSSLGWPTRRNLPPKEALRFGLVDRIIDVESPEPVRLWEPKKRQPTAWLRSWRETFEGLDLR